MRQLIVRYRAPLVALFALAIYWPPAIVTEDNFQSEWLRAMQATTLTVAFLFFGAALHRAFKLSVPESARRFYLGLILWASAADGGALWRLLWRMAGGGDELDWMLSNDLAAFLLWMEIVGLFFILSGPTVPSKGEVSLGNGQPADSISWRRVILAATLCFGVAYVVVVERVGGDHVHSFVNWLKPAYLNK